MNLIGRCGLDFHADNPFIAADRLLRGDAGPRHAPQKQLHALLRRDAQHRADGPRHAQVRHIAGPLGQHLPVRRGHVGVGAPQGGHPAVQIVPHGQLLAGGLGVEIHHREPGRGPP